MVAVYVWIRIIRAYRKEDFRELKQLQREEMKEATEFFTKIKLDREIQEKKFEMENMVSESEHGVGSVVTFL